MFNLDQLLRPHIKGLKPYASARDEYEGNEGIFLDANENAYGSATSEPYNRYPDPHQRELKRKIAEIKGVPADQIFLGNGSDEPIDLIYRLFCSPGKDNVIIMPPTYGMYEVSATLNEIELRRVDLTSDFQIRTKEVLAATDKNTKLIWCCTPNNPTGNDVSTEAIKQIIENFEGVVIVDEAYIDFSSQESFLKLLNKYPNLIVIQTFSKAWGLAGLRLGSIDVIYNLYSIPYNHHLMFKVELKRNVEGEAIPEVPSLAGIWRTADWLERETYDLMGINFTNHPDLRRILLPTDWQGHPLRKDFSLPDTYHGIKVEY